MSQATPLARSSILDIGKKLPADEDKPEKSKGGEKSKSKGEKSKEKKSKAEKSKEKPAKLQAIKATTSDIFEEHNEEHDFVQPDRI